MTRHAPTISASSHPRHAAKAKLPFDLFRPAQEPSRSGQGTGRCLECSVAAAYDRSGIGATRQRCGPVSLEQRRCAACIVTGRHETDAAEAFTRSAEKRTARACRIVRGPEFHQHLRLQSAVRAAAVEACSVEHEGHPGFLRSVMPSTVLAGFEGVGRKKAAAKIAGDAKGMTGGHIEAVPRHPCAECQSKAFDRFAQRRHRNSGRGIDREFDGFDPGSRNLLECSLQVGERGSHGRWRNRPADHAGTHSGRVHSYTASWRRSAMRSGSRSPRPSRTTAPRSST